MRAYAPDAIGARAKSERGTQAACDAPLAAADTRDVARTGGLDGAITANGLDARRVGYQASRESVTPRIAVRVALKA